jgi:hypothetical protein
MVDAQTVFTFSNNEAQAGIADRIGSAYKAFVSIFA